MKVNPNHRVEIERVVNACEDVLRTARQAQAMLTEAARVLAGVYLGLTPRLLDNLIWNRESNRSRTIAPSCHERR
jgi:hypothetical protein